MPKEEKGFPRRVLPHTGRGNGWDRLKKSICAELNEGLLVKFHGTVPPPFGMAQNKKATMEVMGGWGIESLKILETE